MAPARAVRSGRCVANGRGGERRKGLSCVASARGCSRREMLLQASRAGAGAALCHGAPPSESFAAAVKVRCFAASWRPGPRSALLLHQALCAAPQGTDISAYLPEDPSSPGWIRFRPDPNKTPALRSGAVRPYSLLLPRDGGWKEQSVPNGAPPVEPFLLFPPSTSTSRPASLPAAISGNYCQPKCATQFPSLRLQPRAPLSFQRAPCSQV
jgi:hypothetical protein